MDIKELLNPGPTPRIRRTQLTRDQRCEIQALRKYTDFSLATIANRTGYSKNQVQYACSHPLTPRKEYKDHRKKYIRTPDRERLNAFLRESRENRFIPYDSFRFYIDNFDYGYSAIKAAMQILGYSRRLQVRRIYRTQANKDRRVRWAEDMLARFPTPESWETVGFSDETWAVNDPQWKQWVTIHTTEDPEDFALLRRRPNGWMFLGQFAGRHKGPAFVWEKEYGGITSQKYQQHILPLAEQFYREKSLTIYQQDNAPAHTALATRFAFQARDIDLMIWPPNSPDIAPIENVWGWMKSWIEYNYNIQSLTLPTLRAAIWEA